MNIYLNEPTYKYDTENMLRVFFPFEKITFNAPDEYDIVIDIKKLNDGMDVLIKVNLNGTFFSESYHIVEKDYTEYKRSVLLKVYKKVAEITDYNAPWGMLTGVRPVNLYKKLLLAGSEEYADSYFKNMLMVKDDKINLCKFTYEKESSIISLSRNDSFSLYIGIPFCPSRCSYCSFVSHATEKSGKLIPRYVELLCEEIKFTAKVARDLHLRLETVYIGGGTPTTLSSDLLDKLITTVNDSFDCTHIREFTIEAGRPDTITEDKLRVIKDSNVTRISINPQTMNDEVLVNIGRRHTVEETVNAYNLARKVGLNNINMDLIAGLNGDYYDSFKHTINSVCDLSPESITVHTLCYKRSSALSKSNDYSLLKMGKEVEEYLKYGYEKLEKSGYLPYYMYKQSKMIGNLENVGYAKEGYESYYNVYIMDETHSILGCGATAVTKLRMNDRFKRIYNYKYPYEYIDNFEEMLNRKKEIYDFYDEKE